MNNSNKKNLILGVIKGYNFEDIKPFIISLNESGFKGDICLFTLDLIEQTCSSLRKYGIQLVSFKEEYPFISDISDSDLFSEIPHSRLSITYLRHFLYYLFLSNYGKRYSKVMFTDVRDVVFQRDPFDFKVNNSLCCFLEDKRMRINTCKHNSRWIKYAFGEKILSEIGNNYISCAGITIGTVSQIMDYLRKMTNCLKQINSLGFIDQEIHNSLTYLIDQGIHNYLIYSNQFNDLKLFENENGPVLTLGYKRKETIRFNEKGFMINDNGDIVNVIHQYDRHPFLAKKFYKQYGVKFINKMKLKAKIFHLWKKIREIAKKSSIILNIYETIYLLHSYPKDFKRKLVQIAGIKFKKIRLFLKVKPYTLLHLAHLNIIYELSKFVEKNKLKGAFVECGVWKGGSSAIMAYLAKKANSNREIWLFDSFEGVPEPTMEDGKKAIEIAQGRISGKLKPINSWVGTLDDVKEILFLKLKINEKNIKIRKGWFQDTLPQAKSEINNISILHLDGDWYKSIKICLESLYDKVISGGYIIIDDYYYWQGCKKAVDEFLGNRNINVKLNRITNGIFFKKL